MTLLCYSEHPFLEIIKQAMCRSQLSRPVKTLIFLFFIMFPPCLSHPQCDAVQMDNNKKSKQSPGLSIPLTNVMGKSLTITVCRIVR